MKVPHSFEDLKIGLKSCWWSIKSHQLYGYTAGVVTAVWLHSWCGDTKAGQWFQLDRNITPSRSRSIQSAMQPCCCISTPAVLYKSLYVQLPKYNYRLRDKSYYHDRYILIRNTFHVVIWFILILDSLLSGLVHPRHETCSPCRRSSELA